MNATQNPLATVPERIQALRAALKRHSLAAVLIPTSDPHLSEYVPERWQGRQWASGFTGSAGTLLVGTDFAGVWVDNRYWEQAERELAGSGVVLMKSGSAPHPAPPDWLAAHLVPGAVVAVDGAVLGLEAARTVQKALAPKNITVRTDLDVLDEAWSDRPALPSAPVYAHARAPIARAHKLEQVRHALQEAGAQWHFMSTLDDVAWLTNLRGADVEYNPVFLAHALISASEATLFVGTGKVPAALVTQLNKEGFRLEDYDQAAARLAQLADTTVLIDPKRITYGFFEHISPSVTVIEALNPSTRFKARKTTEEIEHIRLTMAHDGAALVEFFCWLEHTLNDKTEPVTELTVDERLCALRARQPGFVCPSFPTIAGFNANGALPHYRATPKAYSVIEGDGLLLIDSGGQYETGTTDITRVVGIGQPSDAQKRDFTYVLKGMIALSMARFPRGTRSPTLDALARAPIWNAGADYGHGTGHGVGYFLNVHEGPHGISPNLPAAPHTAMEPGMVTSNEPGIYRPGHWGVRIENLILNVFDTTTEFGDFLKFETLTLCPIDTRLIDRSLMRADEIAWLNDYHEQVRQRLTPLVVGEAQAWLQARTEPI